MLLLQRPAGRARPMQVSGEQVAPRARSVACQFADGQHEVAIDACVGRTGERCGSDPAEYLRLR